MIVLVEITEVFHHSSSPSILTLLWFDLMFLNDNEIIYLPMRREIGRGLLIRNVLIMTFDLSLILDHIYLTYVLLRKYEDTNHHQKLS